MDFYIYSQILSFVVYLPDYDYIFSGTWYSLMMDMLNTVMGVRSGKSANKVSERIPIKDYAIKKIHGEFGQIVLRPSPSAT